MSKEVLAAIIITIPGVLWVLFAMTIAVILYRPVRRDLLPRMGGVQAFGVELTFLREGLESIVTSPDRSLSPQQVDQVSRRAYRSAAILQGAKVLWIDDNPGNNNYERRFLNSVGVMVDIATSSGEADRMMTLTRSDYDLLISDIARDGQQSAGIAYLDRIRRNKHMVPLIFYTYSHDPSLGIPSGAFGVTEYPDELLNLAMDVLERKRG